MSLYLRLDIDKPYYGNQIKRLFSKLSENYYFPKVHAFGYLSHLHKFLKMLNEKEIKSHIYFRNCTTPFFLDIVDLCQKGGHHIGFHAENTLSEKTFLSELSRAKESMNDLNVRSFTKHGSGNCRLGRYHYPPYEEEKYVAFSKKFDIDFFFGNRPITIDSNFKSMIQCFWIEQEYRASDEMTIDWLIQKSIDYDICVLIHPENYVTRTQVKNDFDRLLLEAEKQKIRWECL